jgi:hypothetical protein
MPEQTVLPNDPDVDSRPLPNLALDGQGRGCLAWTNLLTTSRYLIASCFWNGTSWGDEIPVGHPDSTDSDYSSAVACGGGEFWCVMDRAPTLTYQPFSIWASRWDSTSESWTPEVRVSPPDSGVHWFRHVAVDQQGHPHVVWCEVFSYAIYYSFYDGHEWSRPIVINDTSRVKAPSRAAPRIAIDDQGGLHVCFTGVAAGAGCRNLFYTTYDGARWTPAVSVTHDTIYNEWYSDIAVGAPNNVWVVWERQGESTDQFRIYASHFDGTVCSPDARLDDGQAYYDESCRIALDSRGAPWVVWGGETYGPGSEPSDIYFNRYLNSSLAERKPLGSRTPGELSVRVLPSGRAQISYYVSVPGAIDLRIYDQTGRCVRHLAGERQTAGNNTTQWNGFDLKGRAAPSGVYFCNLRTKGTSVSCKFVLLAR